MGGKTEHDVTPADFNTKLLSRVSEGRFREDIDVAASKFKQALGSDHPLVADELELRSLAYHFLIDVIAIDEHLRSSGEVRLGQIKNAVSRVEKARAELEAAHEALLSLTASLAAVNDPGYADNGVAILVHPGEGQLSSSVEYVRLHNAEIEKSLRTFLAGLSLPSADRGGPSLTEKRRGRGALRFGRRLARYYVAQGWGLYGSSDQDFASTLRALWRAGDGGDLTNEDELLAELRSTPSFSDHPVSE